MCLTCYRFVGQVEGASTSVKHNSKRYCCSRRVFFKCNALYKTRHLLFFSRLKQKGFLYMLISLLYYSVNLNHSSAAAVVAFAGCHMILLLPPSLLLDLVLCFVC